MQIKTRSGQDLALTIFWHVVGICAGLSPGGRFGKAKSAERGLRRDENPYTV
tara:strand:+ start:22199 stop:22354 length:156 start_codon:yes stop_codon:yes gene_type:complete